MIEWAKNTANEATEKVKIIKELIANINTLDFEQAKTEEEMVAIGTEMDIQSHVLFELARNALCEIVYCYQNAKYFSLTDEVSEVVVNSDEICPADVRSRVVDYANFIVELSEPAIETFRRYHQYNADETTETCLCEDEQ